MTCNGCGFENPPGMKFCGQCAAPLAARCSGCGSENPPGFKFCGGCGAKLVDSSQSRVERGGAARLSTLDSRLVNDPRTYTPKHLADKILTSRSALEGERKQVTVLFADVKGSMDLASQVDPEEWHQILDHFFQILTEGVHRFEGTVNQYTGDGIMALFGAPIAHEDHARRACYAALHLLDGLRAYANELRLRRGLNFSARLGINSGEVIVGKIGDDLRMDYTAQGHTVGLAARMEQIAEPGKAYLTAHTAAEVQGYFALADLGEMEIKGVQGALHVYELQGLGQMRTRLDVSRSRGFSRFVGRGDEMHVLESGLARAQEGNAQIIGIVGEAGLGKSRLCYEFLERCRARGLMTSETAGVAHGKAIPYMPLLRLWRAFYGINEADSDATAREKIAGRLLLLDERLRETLPLVFDFFGVSDPELPAPRMDPEARQRQLFEVVRRVVQARGRKETTVTLLEDLHWFDGGSEAFLEPLLDAMVGATRSLVILNFRPEYQAPWMSKSYYQQLPLSPLGADAIRELLDALLGNDPSIAGLAEAIHARTAGNPFFTEEVVQNLIESGKLQGCKGAYRLVTPVDKLEVPSSVHALLAARIDRLAEREKDVLQTAAVIGREFDEPTLAAVVEQDAPQLREALHTLKDTEFVYEQSLYPIAEYLFKHPLTQEVALASQLQERRKRLHAAVARVIEAAHAHDLDQQAALLAHHWEAAGEMLTAARWHGRAAAWVGTSDAAQALNHWQKVRVLLQGTPALRSVEGSESAEAAELGVAACVQILQLGWRLGMSEDDAAELLAEGKTLAARSGEPRLLSELLASYGGVRGLAGDTAGYVEYTTEAARAAERTDNTALKMNVAIPQSYSLILVGRLRDSAAVSEQVLSMAPGDAQLRSGFLNVDPYAYHLMSRAAIAVEMGEIATAGRGVERALQLAREEEDMENLTWAHGWFVTLAYRTGEVAGALGHARQAVEIAEKVGSSVNRMLAYMTLGLAHLVNREWDAALQAEEQSLRIARESRAGLVWESAPLMYLSEGHLGRGDSSQALECAEEAVAVAQRCGTPLFEADALLARARALLRVQGHRASAAIEQDLAQVQTIVEQTAGRCREPFILEARAELAQLAGDETSRQRELRAAHRLFTAMGATGHAKRIESSIQWIQ
jgi:class 3 adenylate cyclase/tetratricopeptide (TPR) repeat protein